MRENRCESILEHSPTAYALHRILCDDSGQPHDYEFLYVNPSFESLFGMPSGGIPCRLGSLSSLGGEWPGMNRRDADAWLVALRDAADGETRTIDHYFPSLRRWLRITVFRTEPETLVTAVHDVTQDRNRMEDMACLLASSQAFLQQEGASFDFQRATTDMLSIVGAKLAVFGLYDPACGHYVVQAVSGMQQTRSPMDGRLLFGACWPDAAERMKAMPREGILSFASVDAVPDGLLPPSVRQWMKGNGLNGELVLLGIAKGRDRLGGYLLVMPEGNVFRKADVAGIYAHQLGLMLARRRIEAHLKEREERYRTVTQTTMDGFYVVDGVGRIVEVNDAYCTMSGYRRDQLLSMHLWDIVDVKRPERLMQEMESIRSLGSFHFESVHRRADGSHFHVHVRIAYQATQVLYLCFINDITERVRMQQSLREAIEAKSRFLANMSHEIRTPMNGFMGMLQLLETTRLDEEQAEYVRVARTSSEILLTVINDILDFSKIESGMMVLEQAPFQIRRVVEEACDLFRAGAARRGIAIESHVASDVPLTMRGDAFRLRQILSNLIGNADKFTQQGRITVEVNLLEGEDRGHIRLAVSVTDTGTGIPSDKIDRLFKSFSQVDPSDTRKFGGSGLGLSICKGLVEKMDGEIGVTSQPGVGSTFRFTCTLWPAGEEAPATPEPMNESGGIH